MYRDFLLLEDKEDNDDGLLSHGRNKKENPLYSDYKNQQIMSGKVVKSEKGWKKEEKRKAKLKRYAKLALAGAGAYALHRSMESPDKKAARGERKALNAQIKSHNKQAIRIAKKNGRKQAKTEEKFRRHEAKNNKNQLKNEVLEREGKSTSGIRGAINRATFEESINYLFENYTNEELINYIYINESKNKDELMREYEKYVNKCIKQNKKPMSFKEFKSRKKSINKKIKLLALAGGATGLYLANEKGIRDNKGSIREKIRYKKTNRRTDANIRDINNKSKNVNKIFNNNINANGALYEELEDLINLEDINLYIETINYDIDFNKKSYNSYCVMMESRGLEPLDESAFSDIKKQIASYSKAAINGIKEEKKKKEKKLEELKEKKEEEKKKKRKAEEEMLKNMTPEEKKRYLLKKAKEEEEKEQEKQDKHDIKQTFKKGFASGSGEQLGKSAVKMATKVFLR